MRTAWKKTFVMSCAVGLVLVGVSAASAAGPADDVTAEDNTFYACIRNSSDKKVFYSRKWCSSGNDCEEYKSIRIGPGEEFEHSIQNWQTIVIRYQSGGENGKWQEYVMDGSPVTCMEESMAMFTFNERGFLRLEPTPARTQELSLAGNQVRKKVADAANLSEDGAAAFESIEVDILTNLFEQGVPIYVPEHAKNNATADYKVALNLGIAVADAVSSVVMHDKEKFLKFAKTIYEYGEILDVEETILVKYNRITSNVSAEKWDEVETLLYDLKDDITRELFAGDMRDSATLAMISGWMEGLYIVARSLDINFSEDASRLMRDRDFVRYLSDHLQRIDKDLRESREIKALILALPEIDKVINKPISYTYTRDDVREVIRIYEPLRRLYIN